MAPYDSVISPGNADRRILPQLIFFFFPRGVPEPETVQIAGVSVRCQCFRHGLVLRYRSPICLSAKKRDCLPLLVAIEPKKSLRVGMVLRAVQQ